MALGDQHTDQWRLLWLSSIFPQYLLCIPLNLGQFRIENRTKENFNGSKKILNLAAPERLRGATTQTNFPHPAATTPGVPHPHQLGFIAGV